MVPVLLETMPHRRPYHSVHYEFHYPYVDRDLLDFLLRVPWSGYCAQGEDLP
ncbi:hypothetical protein AB4Y89_19235 [Terriglobus sp. 2YAB30_2]|uniref:hypothetical protein n=1 Tax=unclassified Terriglobus TaxID=2628988 RepID=UPI003F9DA68D